MKKCPYCAEEVQEDAVLCRHCGSSLTGGGPGNAVPGGFAGGVQAAPQWPGYQPSPMPQTNSMAVAALITGILFIPVVPIVLGHISKKEIDASQGRQTGRGMAVAGLVLGWIEAVLFILMIIAVMVFGAVFSSSVTTLISKDQQARNMLQDSMTIAGDYSRAHGSFDGISANELQKLSGSQIRFNDSQIPIAGQVSVRSGGANNVVLVTRTSLGLTYCMAKADGLITNGNQNARSPSECSGGWWTNGTTNGSSGWSG